jgi:hypothetical protein
MGLTAPHLKNELFTKDHKTLQTWVDSLDKRPKRKKMDMRFGTWNAKSRYRAGSLRAVVEEISKYKVDLVGLQEVRWNKGDIEPAGEYTFFLWKGE